MAQRARFIVRPFNKSRKHMKTEGRKGRRGLPLTRPGAGFFISRTETVRDKYSTCKGELAQTEARLVRGCGSERHVLHGVAVFLRWRMLVTSADKSWTIHKSLAMRIGARRGRSLLLLEESVDCVATRVGERLEARQTRQGCNQRPGERLAGGVRLGLGVEETSRGRQHTHEETEEPETGCSETGEMACRARFWSCHICHSYNSQI